MQNEFSDSQEQSSNEPSAPKSRGSGMPRLEVIIIGVFFVSFVIWAVRSCGKTRQEYEQQEQTEKIQDSIEQVMNEEIATPIQPKEEEVPVEEVAESIVPQTKLYVTLENLNMRDRPSLSGKILDRLKLFDEVIYLNEVTDFRQEIELGSIVTNEPWIKVKTEDGTEGWVYGAGVHYYKTKLDLEKSGNYSSPN